MVLFHYEATDANGQPVKGQLEAEDYAQLVQLLQTQGLFLISWQEGDAGSVSALPADQSPEEKKFSGPVKRPFQYAMVAVVFVVFVLIGYWFGK
jgi:type II secretory pathway component PulF